MPGGDCGSVIRLDYLVLRGRELAVLPGTRGMVEWRMVVGLFVWVLKITEFPEARRSLFCLNCKGAFAFICLPLMSDSVSFVLQGSSILPPFVADQVNFPLPRLFKSAWSDVESIASRTGVCLNSCLEQLEGRVLSLGRKRKVHCEFWRMLSWLV